MKNSKGNQKTKQKEFKVKGMVTKAVVARWLERVLKKEDATFILSHIDLFERIDEIFSWYKERKTFGAVCLRGDKRIYRIFEMKELLYISADGGYSILHYIDGSTEIVTLNLSALHNTYIASNITDFVRVHRSYVVNLKYFKYLGTNFIETKDHTVNLPFSKHYINNMNKHVSYFGRLKF